MNERMRMKTEKDKEEGVVRYRSELRVALEFVLRDSRHSKHFNESRIRRRHFSWKRRDYLLIPVPSIQIRNGKPEGNRKLKAITVVKIEFLLLLLLPSLLLGARWGGIAKDVGGFGRSRCCPPLRLYPRLS